MHAALSQAFTAANFWRSPLLPGVNGNSGKESAAVADLTRDPSRKAVRKTFGFLF
jgi:hypothetical protein